MKTITTRILCPSRSWINDFYKSLRPLTKRILKVQREAIRDTMRSSCSDYLRKMLRKEFGDQVPWEVLDGLLTFHATRGTSPFLQNKVYQQNRLNFPVFLHRRAIRNIRQITPTKFLIT